MAKRKKNRKDSMANYNSIKNVLVKALKEDKKKIENSKYDTTYSKRLVEDLLTDIEHYKFLVPNFVYDWVDNNFSEDVIVERRLLELLPILKEDKIKEWLYDEDSLALSSIVNMMSHKYRKQPIYTATMNKAGEWDTRPTGTIYKIKSTGKATFYVDDLSPKEYTREFTEKELKANSLKGNNLIEIELLEGDPAQKSYHTPLLFNTFIKKQLEEEKIFISPIRDYTDKDKTDFEILVNKYLQIFKDYKVEVPQYVADWYEENGKNTPRKKYDLVILNYLEKLAEKPEKNYTPFDKWLLQPYSLKTLLYMKDDVNIEIIKALYTVKSTAVFSKDDREQLTLYKLIDKNKIISSSDIEDYKPSEYTEYFTKTELEEFKFLKNPYVKIYKKS